MIANATKPLKNHYPNSIGPRRRFALLLLVLLISILLIFVGDLWFTTLKEDSVRIATTTTSVKEKKKTTTDPNVQEDEKKIFFSGREKDTRPCMSNHNSRNDTTLLMTLLLDPSQQQQQHPATSSTHNTNNWTETFVQLQQQEEDSSSIFATCPTTCAVQLIVRNVTTTSTTTISCEDYTTSWELQSLDCQGNPKTMGGDEYYVTFTDASLAATNAHSKDEDVWTQPVSAVAWIQDQSNGRYTLDFQASPMSPSSLPPHRNKGGGIVTVYFQYTCGIGRMAFPLKKNWTNGGQSVTWARTESLSLLPPLRPFEIPEHRPNIWNFTNIIPIGDSLLQHFMEVLGMKFTNMNQALNSTTLYKWKSTLRSQMNFKDQSACAIIAGSCAWDIFELQKVRTTTPMELGSSNNHTEPPQWMDHQLALSRWLSFVHQTYPNVTIFWKSCAGFHIHVPYLHQGHTPGQRRTMDQRLKYMSTSRATSIHQVQMQVVQQAQLLRPGKVHFLNVYPAMYLSADYTRPGDGRHYQYNINSRIANWFLNESITERSWRQRKPKLKMTQTIIVKVPTNAARRSTGWVDWVNAAVIAKAGQHKIVWRRGDEDDGHPSPSGFTTIFEGGTDNVWSSFRVLKHPLVKPASQHTREFVNAILPSESRQSRVHGMILKHILTELAGKEDAIKRNVLLSSLEEGSKILAVAPFSDISLEDRSWKTCLDKIFPSPTSDNVTGTQAEGCSILAPSMQTSRIITDYMASKHINCNVHVHDAYDDPWHAEETLAIAQQLVKFHEQSSVLLSCSKPSSNLFLRLLNHLLEEKVRQKGELPLEEYINHCCLN